MSKIKLSNVKKCYNSGFCLKNINFEVYGGEIFGFLGVNGAGKTTTIRIMLNVLSLDEGKIILQRKNGEYISLKDIGFVLEEEKPFENLSPVEYFNFFASNYGLQKGDRENRIENMLQKLNLLKRKNERISNFSKGMKRKLTIGKALLHDPEILILDEPLTGIEPKTRSDIKSILKDFASREKIVFLSTHNLDEAERLCSSFGIIDEGSFKGKWQISELKGSLENFFIQETRKV